MAGIAVTWYVLAAVVAVVVVWVASRRRDTFRADATTALALRTARRRAVVAIGFALMLLFTGFAIAIAVPRWLGLSAAIAPAVAGAGGLLLYAATPPPQEREPRGSYSASLEARGPWRVAPHPSRVFLGAGFLFLLGLLIFTGATSTVDDLGLSRAITFTAGPYSSTATPYPGWFYAGPLIAATALLAGGVWTALGRIATTASLPGEDLEDLDRLWRARSAQIIVGIAFAAVLLQFGGVAVFAGTTMGNAQFQPGVPIGWHVLAVCLLILGNIAMAVSIVSLTLAALRAFALPGQSIPADGSSRERPALPPTARGRV